MATTSRYHIAFGTNINSTRSLFRNLWLFKYIENITILKELSSSNISPVGNGSCLFTVLVNSMRMSLKFSFRSFYRLLVDDLFAVKQNNTNGLTDAKIKHQDTILGNTHPKNILQITRGTQTGTCLQW